MSAGCAGCAAPLAADQLYCVECGLRCAPDMLWLGALPWADVAVPVAVPARVVARRPAVRSAAITALVVLSGGIAIGATLGPTTVGETAAAQTPLLLSSLTAPSTASGAGASTPVRLAPPSDDLVQDDDGGFTSDPLLLSDATEPEPVTAAPASSTPIEVAEPEVAPNDDGAEDLAAAPEQETAGGETGAGDGGAESGGGGETGASDGAGESPTSDPAAAVAPAGSRALAGVVVEVDASGEGFALADRRGRLLELHASGCDVAVGDSLHLRARRLANGTWSADRVRRLRSGIERIGVVGVVSHVDPATSRYALAARGVTLLVTAAAPTPATATPQSPAGTTPAAPNPAPPATSPAPAATTPTAATEPPPATPAPAPPGTTTTTTVPPTATTTPGLPPALQLPAVGDRLRVTLTLASAPDASAPATSAPDAGSAPLVERARRLLSRALPEAPPLELDGTIDGVDTSARTVVLALDPADPAPAKITLRIPKSIDLAALLPAQQVAATARADADGSYELVGVAPDGDAAAAYDPAQAQGELRPARTDANTTVAVVAGCTMLD